MQEKLKSGYKVDFLREGIAIAVAESRTEKKLTQLQLAFFSKVSRSVIAAIEAADTATSCENLYAIIEALALRPEDFFARVEEIRKKCPKLSNKGRGNQRKISFSKC